MQPEYLTSFPIYFMKIEVGRKYLRNIGKEEKMENIPKRQNGGFGGQNIMDLHFIYPCLDLSLKTINQGKSRHENMANVWVRDLQPELKKWYVLVSSILMVRNILGFLQYHSIAYYSLYILV